MLVRHYSSSREYRKQLVPVLTRIFWRSLFGLNWRARFAMLLIWLRRALVWLPFKLKARRLGVRMPVTLSVVDDIACKAGCANCVFTAFTVRGPGLALDDLERLFDQALALNITNVYLIGSDPFYRDNASELIALLARKRWQLFLLFTEGRRLDDEHLARIRRAGNIVPVLNIDGLEEATDARKSEGAFAAIETLMAKLRDARMPFFVSTMVSQANWDEVTSVPYLHWLEEKGAWLLAYVPYTAVDHRAEVELVLGQDERQALFQRSLELNRQVHRLVVLDLLGIEEHLTQCPAGVYGMTVYHDGTVTLCPAVCVGHSDANIRQRSLADVFVNDPLYRAVRELHERAQGPVRCLFYSDPTFLRRYITEHQNELRVLNPGILDVLGLPRQEASE